MAINDSLIRKPETWTLDDMEAMLRSHTILLDTITQGFKDSMASKLASWLKKHMNDILVNFMNSYFFLSILVNPDVPKQAVGNFDVIDGKHLNTLAMSMTLVGCASLGINIMTSAVAIFRLCRKGKANRTPEEDRQLIALLVGTSNEAAGLGFYFASIFDQPLAKVVDKLSQHSGIFSLTGYIWCWLSILDVSIQAGLLLKANQDIKEVSEKRDAVLLKCFGEDNINALSSGERDAVLINYLANKHHPEKVGKLDLKALSKMSDDDIKELEQAQKDLISARQSFSNYSAKLCLATLKLALVITMLSFPPSFGAAVLGVMLLSIVSLAYEAYCEVSSSNNKQKLASIDEQPADLQQSTEGADDGDSEGDIRTFHR